MKFRNLNRFIVINQKSNIVINNLHVGWCYDSDYGSHLSVSAVLQIDTKERYAISVFPDTLFIRFEYKKCSVRLTYRHEVNYGYYLTNQIHEWTIYDKQDKIYLLIVHEYARNSRDRDLSLISIQRNPCDTAHLRKKYEYLNGELTKFILSYRRNWSWQYTIENNRATSCNIFYYATGNTTRKEYFYNAHGHLIDIDYYHF